MNWTFPAEGAAVNPNGINKILAIGLSIFFINGKATLGNGPRSLLTNPPDCIILDGRVFDKFTLINELFAKAL